MNTFNIKDSDYVNSESYKNFIRENSSRGSLKIRAFAASGAVPISNLNIIVSKVIDDNLVVFYEGVTNESGVIEKILLPAPKLDLDNMIIPKSAVYDINASDKVNKINRDYEVNIYADVCVVQNINIVPNNLQVGEF